MFGVGVVVITGKAVMFVPPTLTLFTDVGRLGGRIVVGLGSSNFVLVAMKVVKLVLVRDGMVRPFVVLVATLPIFNVTKELGSVGMEGKNTLLLRSSSVRAELLVELKEMDVRSLFELTLI